MHQWIARVNRNLGQPPKLAVCKLNRRGLLKRRPGGGIVRRSLATSPLSGTDLSRKPSKGNLGPQSLVVQPGDRNLASTELTRTSPNVMLGVILAFSKSWIFQIPQRARLLLRIEPIGLITPCCCRAWDEDIGRRNSWSIRQVFWCWRRPCHKVATQGRLHQTWRKCSRV